MMGSGCGPVLGAIADDLTGATDLALTLSRQGMRVTQTVGVPTKGSFRDLKNTDAIVVSLKSRTIPAAEATAQSISVGFAIETAPNTIPLIYASANAEFVQRAQEELGRKQAGTVVEDALGEIARGLVTRGFGRILVAGGETSGAVIEKLGIDELKVGPEIDPGVPWMLAESQGKPLALALKSGSFGADDIFLKARAKLA